MISDLRELAQEVQAAIDLDAPVGIEQLARWRNGFLSLASVLEEIDAGVTEALAGIDQIRDDALSGLLTDGGHHKQWYLEKILEHAGFQMPDGLEAGEEVIILDGQDSIGFRPGELSEEAHEKGDYYVIERGIAP